MVKLFIGKQDAPVIRMKDLQLVRLCLSERTSVLCGASFEDFRDSGALSCRDYGTPRFDDACLVFRDLFYSITETVFT